MKKIIDKIRIVRDVLEEENFPADREYVMEFESRFGELTKASFLKHFDDAEFTCWSGDNGYAG